MAAPAPLDIPARLRAAGCVFAEDEAAVLWASAQDAEHLESLLTRRLTGEPLEQVVGWAEFSGLRIRVGPGVFVPRRRTEWLVVQALAGLRETPGRPAVLDLCCGSGAVSAALAAASGSRPIEMVAVDCDPTAVACATHNAPTATVLVGDLYAPLPVAWRGRFDIITANAPYVPTDELVDLPSEARLHEPPTALDGGRDGLDVQRRIVAGALEWLAPSGRLLIETGRHQADRTAGLFRAAGLTATVSTDDEIAATVVIGSRPPAPAPARDHRP
nr:putative protein N(5)-glutamine methyltransferase [Nakamurella leprariae]